MAHNTFIDGYYINSDGAWTDDIPYALQRLINVLPNSEWIYTYGNDSKESIYVGKEENFKDECRGNWNVPNVNGWWVALDLSEFFVAEDGTLFTAPHQATDTLYRFDENGNIVESYKSFGLI